MAPTMVVQAGQLAPPPAGGAASGWDTAGVDSRPVEAAGDLRLERPGRLGRQRRIRWSTSPARASKRVAMAHAQQSGVQVIDAYAKKVIASALFDLGEEVTENPHGVGISPDGRWLYLGQMQRVEGDRPGPDRADDRQCEDAEAGQGAGRPSRRLVPPHHGVQGLAGARPRDGGVRPQPRRRPALAPRSQRQQSGREGHHDRGHRLQDRPSVSDGRSDRPLRVCVRLRAAVARAAAQHGGHREAQPGNRSRHHHPVRGRQPDRHGAHLRRPIHLRQRRREQPRLQDRQQPPTRSSTAPAPAWRARTAWRSIGTRRFSTRSARAKGPTTTARWWASSIRGRSRRRAISFTTCRCTWAGRRRASITASSTPTRR